MKKYSKGTTLVEIMVSIILISIVMIFIFSILVDLKNEYSIASKRSQDAINRAALTRIIQNDLRNYTLTKITRCSSDTSIVCFNFFLIPKKGGEEISKQLQVTETYAIYDISSSTRKEKWDLSGGKYKPSETKICYISSKDDKMHYLKINIPSNANVASNRKYDLEIVHYDKGKVELEMQMGSSWLPTNQC